MEKTLEVGDKITVGRTTLSFLSVAKEESYRDINDQQISMVVPLAELSRREEAGGVAGGGAQFPGFADQAGQDA